jgi:ribosomal protein S18 acetylase RimI-like enzyme
MTVLDDRQAEPEVDVTFELIAWRPHSWLIRATAVDGLQLTCVVTRPNSDSLLLHEFLPQCRDQRLAGIMLSAAACAGARLGSTEVYAVHPAAWDDHLRDTGVVTLHRMAHLGLLLDDELLESHHRPLPDSYRSVPLREDPEHALAALSGAAPDLAVWRELLSGRYGPVIDDASIAISDNSEVCAAIVISEHLGTPLIGHCVSSVRQRGLGLGRMVLVQSLRRLAKLGYSECELHVVEDNWVARRLYRSVGFEPRRAPLRVSRVLPSAGQSTGATHVR